MNNYIFSSSYNTSIVNNNGVIYNDEKYFTNDNGIRNYYIKKSIKDKNGEKILKEDGDKNIKNIKKYNLLNNNYKKNNIKDIEKINNEIKKIEQKKIEIINNVDNNKKIETIKEIQENNNKKIETIKEIQENNNEKIKNKLNKLKKLNKKKLKNTLIFPYLK